MRRVDEITFLGILIDYELSWKAWDKTVAEKYEGV